MVRLYRDRTGLHLDSYPLAPTARHVLFAGERGLTIG